MADLVKLAMGKPGWGSDFLNVATEQALKLKAPIETVLAVVAWETDNFDAYKTTPAPHWKRNTSDGGYGIIGFTPTPDDWIKEKAGVIPPPAGLKMTPAEQMETFAKYFLDRMAWFKIKTIRNPFEMYCFVRAPSALFYAPDQFILDSHGEKQPLNIGRGANLRHTINTRKTLEEWCHWYFEDQTGFVWRDTPIGIEYTLWRVRIGIAYSLVCFYPNGQCWYAPWHKEAPSIDSHASAKPDVASSSKTWGRWEKNDVFIRWAFGRGYPKTAPEPRGYFELPLSLMVVAEAGQGLLRATGERFTIFQGNEPSDDYLKMTNSI
jgi:hypothetical protein